MADLLEETRIVQESAAEGYRVTGDRESLRENEWGVEHPLGLGGGQLGPQIHPGGDVDGAVKGGVLKFEAPAIPNESDEENSGGQKLLGAGDDGAGMRGDFGWQAPQSRGDEVGGSHYREKGACDFAPWMTRARQEVLDQECD